MTMMSMVMYINKERGLQQDDDGGGESEDDGDVDDNDGALSNEDEA